MINNNLQSNKSVIAIYKNSLFRFVIVGISNTLISYFIFIALYYLLSAISIRTIISQVVGYGVGIIWSFTWNKKWTFKSSGKTTNEFIKFILLQISLLIISTILISLLIDYYNLSVSLSWISIMILIVIINFIITKYYIFYEKR